MKKLSVLLFLFAMTVSAQQLVDKVIAVVDNEVILKSELDFRVGIEAAQRNANPADSTLRRQILTQLIEEKLLYAQAELDSVVVTDDQVKQQLDYQINYFIQQYGSKEKMEQVYGMSVEKIKRQMFDDVRKNLMAEMVERKKFGEVDVSRKEVEEFYSTFKDSLSLIPEKFQIQHIFVNPKTGDRVKAQALTLAKSLLDSVKNGSDFAALAKKYSDDPGSGSQGGDLGFVKRGILVPEFEAVAFSMAPGQISNIVESPFGYHIIQLIERRGESIHTRHILIKIKSDEQADLNAIEFLSEIRDSIATSKNTFEYFAKKYSDDKETARFGGDLGTFESSQLDKTMLDIIYKLKEGEISFPSRIQIDPTSYGYHIVKLFKRNPQHRANIDMDYNEIKKLADYYKKQKLYAEWMSELKQKIYWEVRI